MMRAVSLPLLFLCFQACTGRSPERYAREWCRLNTLILQHTGEERDRHLEAIRRLEKEVKALYPEGSRERTIILERTYACD